MKKLFLLLFTITVFACDSKYKSVDFLEPQPGGSDNEMGFNKKYRGTYDGPEGAQLLILENKIVKIVPYNFLFAKQDIDSSFKGDRNNDEELKSYFENQNMEVLKIIGDSVSVKYISKDTIFNVSERHICRSLNGSYFLNYNYGEAMWKVQRLDLEKNRLSVSMIMPNDSLFQLLPVAEKTIIKNDSTEIVSYQMKPTKKELRKLIKDNAFEVSEVWIKAR